MTVDDHRDDQTNPEAKPPDEPVIPGLDILYRAVHSPLQPLAPPASPESKDKSANFEPAPPDSFVVKTTFRNCGSLGRGGLGVVWSVRDSALGRFVALKQMRGEMAGRPQARRRFIREAQVTGLLEHPSIIPVHLLSAEGSPFYTMQLVRGGTLREAIEAVHERRRMDADVHTEIRRLLATTLRVCDAIAYAHSKGIVHRDLKPANVVLGSFGEVFVLDWGLAKVLDAHSESIHLTESEAIDDGEETRDGQIIGTAAFMAPEQALGKARAVDCRTDVFALGAILYTILTGRPPYVGFPSETQAEKLRRVARCDYPRPSEIDRDLSKPLEAIVLRAMASDPESRYQVVSLLAEDLRRWLDNEPVSVHRDRWPARLSRWASHHPSQATALGVTMAAFAIIAAVLATYIIGGTRVAIDRQKDLLREHVRQAAALTDMALQWAPIALDNLRPTLPLAISKQPGDIDRDALRVFLESLMATDGNYSSVLFVEPKPDGKELLRVVRDGYNEPPRLVEPRPRISDHLAPLVAKVVAKSDQSLYGNWRPITFGKQKTIEFSVATTISNRGQPVGVAIILLTLSEETLSSFVAAVKDDVDGYLVDQSGTILAWISRRESNFSVNQPFSDITVDLLKQLADRPQSEEIFEDDWDDYGGLLFAKRIHYDYNDRSRWLLVAIGKAEAEIVADVWRVLSLVGVITLVLIVASIVIGIVIIRYSLWRRKV